VHLKASAKVVWLASIESELAWTWRASEKFDGTHLHHSCHAAIEAGGGGDVSKFTGVRRCQRPLRTTIIQSTKYGIRRRESAFHETGSLMAPATIAIQTSAFPAAFFPWLLAAH
jgi:hypothetical protein